MPHSLFFSFTPRYASINNVGTSQPPPILTFFHFEAWDHNVEISIFPPFSNRAESFTRVTVLALLCYCVTLIIYGSHLGWPSGLSLDITGRCPRDPSDPTRTHTGTWALDFTRMSRAISKAAVVMYFHQAAPQTHPHPVATSFTNLAKSVSRNQSVIMCAGRKRWQSRRQEREPITEQGIQTWGRCCAF